MRLTEPLAGDSIFLNYFISSLQGQTINNLTPYVLSEWSSHSLLATINIASYLMAGVLKIPIAKIIDTWGRPQGFAVMTFVATLGLILMATSTTVEGFAAAQVFTSVGFSGFGYCLDVIIADTSSLQNRAIAIAFAASPYLATTWAGPALAQRYYDADQMKWAFGTFAILVPVCASGVSGLLWWYKEKARKAGLLKTEPSGRTVLQSILHYAVEFDGKRSYAPLSHCESELS